MIPLTLQLSTLFLSVFIIEIIEKKPHRCTKYLAMMIITILLNLMIGYAYSDEISNGNKIEIIKKELCEKAMSDRDKIRFCKKRDHHWKKGHEYHAMALAACIFNPNIPNDDKIAICALCAQTLAFGQLNPLSLYSATCQLIGSYTWYCMKEYHKINELFETSKLHFELYYMITSALCAEGIYPNEYPSNNATPISTYEDYKHENAYPEYADAVAQCRCDNAGSGRGGDDNDFYKPSPNLVVAFQNSDGSWTEYR